MSESVGKICPYCHKEIKADDETKACDRCGAVYHKACWEKNQRSCVGCGFEEKHIQSIPVANACKKCGTHLEDSQLYCPKCGTPRKKEKSNILQKYNSRIHGKLPVFIVIFVVIIIGIIFFIAHNSKIDFNDDFSHYADKCWCEIAEDGTWMKLDTNPENYKYYEVYTDDRVACETAIESINKQLGFPSSLTEKMNNTTWDEGKQKDKAGKVTVSWTYHPYKGLEVMYEVR